MLPSTHGAWRSARLAVVALMTVAIVSLAPAPAWAHGEGGDSSLDMVRQAIALIVNTPADMGAVSGKIDDALKAQNKAGVKISLVQQAKDTLGSNDMHRVRRLLEAAIGARVHTGRNDPVPIGKAPLVGGDTGTLGAADPLRGRGPLRLGDWILLSVALAVGVAGLALSLRLRPHLSAEAAQHRATGGDRP